MANRFNIIFDGEIMPESEMEKVREGLKVLLKTDDQGISKLFSEQPVVIKKDVDSGIADKYQKAFQKAGAVCKIEPVEEMDAVQDMGDKLTKEKGAEKMPPPMDDARKESSSNQTTKLPQGGSMLITNIETVPGRAITEHFGLVSGSTIRAKHVGRDIMAGLKNIIGGELKGYTELLQESRRQALDRMIEQAKQLGANAIVNVRFSTSSVAQGAAELYAYGTAVLVE